MPLRNSDFEEVDPREYPEQDWDEDGEEDLTKCPKCKLAIFGDSVRCPSCGHYLSEETTSSQPIWVAVVAGILLILIVWFWILGG